MAKKLLGIIAALTTFITLTYAPHANAEDKEYSVFDVRKTLPLNDVEKVYRDYYVNIGTENGVKAGDILAVYRHVPVIDIYRNKAQGDLVVPIAHLTVLQAQKTMAVARVESKPDAKNIPVVQFESVMMGDRVQLAAVSDKKKNSSPAVSGGDDGDDDDDNP